MLLTHPAPLLARTFVCTESDSRRIAARRGCPEPTPNLLCFGRLARQQTKLSTQVSERRLTAASDPKRRVGSPPSQSTKRTSPARASRTNGSTAVPGITSMAALARQSQNGSEATKPKLETTFQPSRSSGLFATSANKDDSPQNGNEATKPKLEVPNSSPQIVFLPSRSSALLTTSANKDDSPPVSSALLGAIGQEEVRWKVSSSMYDQIEVGAFGPKEDLHSAPSFEHGSRWSDGEEEPLCCTQDSNALALPLGPRISSQIASLVSAGNRVNSTESGDRRGGETPAAQTRRVGSPPPLSKIRSGSVASNSPLRSRLSDKAKWTPIMSDSNNSDQRVPSRREHSSEQGMRVGMLERGRSPARQEEALRCLRLSCEAVGHRACPRNSNTHGGSSSSSKASTPEGRRYPSLRAQSSGGACYTITPVATLRTGREIGHDTPEQRRFAQRSQKRLTPERTWRASYDVRVHGVPSTPRPRARTTTTSESVLEEETVVQSLSRMGFLSQHSIPWSHDDSPSADDIDHVHKLFSNQVSNVILLGIHRIKHDGHSILYSAVQDTMESKTERILWHGTSADSVRNIALNGFNRNYCGRHGSKLGHGSYFSVSANYSLRFCDRGSPRRYIFLAKVIVGSWTKGNSDLKEAPYREHNCLLRYDSTVDSVDDPHIFCIFRDFQAVPLYLLELSSSCS